MFTPKFNVFRADGSKVPNLTRSFLIKMFITPFDVTHGAIVLPDETSWDLVIEPSVVELLKVGAVKCIVSFQAYSGGRGNYAVARYYDPKMAVKG